MVMLSPKAYIKHHAEVQTMPLLFYFPLIIWMGMVKVVQDATHDFGEQTSQPPIQGRILYLAKR